MLAKAVPLLHMRWCCRLHAVLKDLVHPIRRPFPAGTTRTALAADRPQELPVLALEQFQLVRGLASPARGART